MDDHRDLDQDFQAEVVRAIGKLINSERLQVPAYPAILMRLTQVLQRDDFALQDVVSLVKSDPALSAQVLRYANSAISGLRSEGTSLDRAISFMGIERLQSLACMSGLHPNVATSGPLSEARRAVWSRAVLRARVSEMLAAHRGYRSDVAFLCGLLCDFGKVVTLRCVEHFLSARSDIRAMPIRFWLRVVRVHEAEVGLIIANRWRLPDSLRHLMLVLARSEPDDDPLVDVVLAADQIVGILRTRPHVTLEELASAPRIRDATERDHVLQSIPRLAEWAARLCPEAAPDKSEPKSKVAPDDDDLRWEAYPVELKVEVTRSTATLQYSTRSVAFDGLEMEGHAPLPSHELVRLIIDTPLGQCASFGTVISATSTGSRHRIMLRFFALSREQKAMWDAVVQRVRPPLHPAAPPRTSPRSGRST